MLFLMIEYVRSLLWRREESYTPVDLFDDQAAEDHLL